jgi:hypothetical protein
MASGFRPYLPTSCLLFMSTAAIIVIIPAARILQDLKVIEGIKS